MFSYSEKLKDSDKIVNKKIVQDCNFSSG